MGCRKYLCPNCHLTSPFLPWANGLSLCKRMSTKYISSFGGGEGAILVGRIYLSFAMEPLLLAHPKLFFFKHPQKKVYLGDSM
jgi:hypothetical protein